MQDVADHILYSPLCCHIPLCGFEGLQFCISQYEEKDNILLKNLCFVLGAKFTKLTKKSPTCNVSLKMVLSTRLLEMGDSVCYR
ncbi:DNA topoisomerase 2-binding protein 1 [Iris pallida]|uniref:DNA topoisomerase 2-binding protein 1 n=1 Tax=Iris pallida TaxID=29817 RepID=A0AAX6G2S4_IRIPA|nr:DNA topoisomerase 2-binding protein 1 [Iris pallida]